MQCDGCKKWYHFECQDFDPRTPEKVKWFCENCDYFRDPLSFAEKPRGKRKSGGMGAGAAAGPVKKKKPLD